MSLDPLIIRQLVTSVIVGAVVSIALFRFLRHAKLKKRHPLQDGPPDSRTPPSIIVDPANPFSGESKP